jgi:hypothetical protein
MVEESHVAGGKRVLILRDRNEVFEASFPLSGKGSAPVTDIGSLLLLTGICVVHVDLDHNPVSFGILMRPVPDIVVLSPGLVVDSGTYSGDTRCSHGTHDRSHTLGCDSKKTAFSIKPTLFVRVKSAFVISHSMTI